MSYISDSTRKVVTERANGCCEYCLIAQAYCLYAHEIDHIIPEKHRGETVAGNLCLDCNRHKGSNFASFDPDTNDVTLLFDPRKQNWNDHFHLENGFIQPLTPVGRVTVFVLRLNDEVRVRARRALTLVGLYPCNPT